MVRLVLLALTLGIMAACSTGPTGSGSDTAADIRPDQWSGVAAQFGEQEARFDFRYANTGETLYKVHASTHADMSWDVFVNFATGGSSPLVVQNPSALWSTYRCGATLYWRLEAVYTGRIHSGIQGPTTVQC
jgi:hypothetical protein